MKFKINRKDLLTALKHCSRLARKRNEIPVTDCVIIDMVDAEPTKQGEQLLRLRATDLEIWVEVHVEAEVEQRGCIAPLRVNLERIIAAIPHEEVVISSQKDRITVCPGDLSGEYPVSCLTADLYPAPDEESENTPDPRFFSFENDGIIDRVLAKSSGDAKHGHSDVPEDIIGSLSFYDLGGASLTAVHHRGHSGGFEISDIPREVGYFDVPVPGAMLISGLDTANIYVSDKWVRVESGNLVIAIRRNCGRAAGEIGQTKTVVEGFANKVAIDRFGLLGAIKRVKMCEEISKTGNAVFLEFGEPLTVKGEIGDGMERIDAQLDGNVGKILLATSLIEHQLAVLGDNLSISFPDIGEGGVCQAVCIRDLDNEGYLGFIAGRMP
jgi:DNA polymerase III sliding clamp (beta) subunit (PCNA family)